MPAQQRNFCSQTFIQPTRALGSITRLLSSSETDRTQKLQNCSTKITPHNNSGKKSMLSVHSLSNGSIALDYWRKGAALGFSSVLILLTLAFDVNFSTAANSHHRLWRRTGNLVGLGFVWPCFLWSTLALLSILTSSLDWPYSCRESRKFAIHLQLVNWGSFLSEDHIVIRVLGGVSRTGASTVIVQVALINCELRPMITVASSRLMWMSETRSWKEIKYLEVVVSWKKRKKGALLVLRKGV